MATLEERVGNHIKFFWVVVGFGFLWLGALSALVVQTKTRVTNLPLEISESLTEKAKQYAQSGNQKTATHLIELAQGAVVSAADQKVRAKPEFFQRQVSTIGAIANPSPELSSQINGLRFALAAYRSQITPPPSIPGETHEAGPTPLVTIRSRMILGVPWAPSKGSSISGSGEVALDGHKLSQDILIPLTRSIDENQNVVSDIILMNAGQTLDGIIWRNVIFVNMRIKYLSGSLSLQNVKFVNCTFQLPDDPDGSRIADYAALAPSEKLTIG